MVEAPGISIKSVLSAAPDNDIRNFIGVNTINVIAALDSKLITRENLLQIAIQSAEPIEMLRQQITRDRIIGLLSLPKARELAKKLGIQDSNESLYEKLFNKAAGKQVESILRDFFGVVIPERASKESYPSVIEVKPKYGLFTHQRHVADNALSSLRRDPNKVVIHMPTGSGKTRTAMYIVSKFINKYPNRIIIWLAHNAELLEQAADEFERAWSCLGSFPCKVYRFWGTHEPNLNDIKTGLLIAGFGKLNALYNRDANMIMCLGDRSVLTVVDEAHQSIAPTYKSLILNLYNKKPDNSLLGLTATPGRTWADIGADEELSNFFGNNKVMLQVPGHGNPVKYLIEQGYLAQPCFRTLNIDSGIDLNKDDIQELSQAYDIPEAILEHLANDEKRSIRIITTIKEMCQNHKRIIVFASTVKHAYQLASILNILGIEAFVVTGNTDKTSRDRILSKFKSAAINPMIICNYGVLTTGFDAPQTSAVIIARPTNSLVLYSQMVGRAIRGPRAGGNAQAEIVTVVDPHLPGFGSIADAFVNWEDVWNEQR